MKSTSIFGGVQVFQILISIIRSKFVAVLLGPTGMGIVSLLTSTLQIIGKLTNMGLEVSAVKNIADANATDDQIRIATTVTVFRRWVWITGSLGFLITFIFAPLLSKMTFGNNDFTFAFRWVSITLLISQISSGQMVVLQGFRKLQYLAKASLIGSIAGLIVTIPLYFLLGVDGIVPVMVAISVVTLLVSYYFSNKLKIESPAVSKEKMLSEGKNMLTMGFMISISGFLGMLAVYLVNIYISNTGKIADVGLYGAGFTLVGTYVGLIFTAMAKDYYPKLCGVNNRSNQNKIVNQQVEIAFLILAPLLTIFLFFIKETIVLLYSFKFLAIVNMVQWAALGVFLQAPSWAMGFILLSKGDNKWFLINESIAVLYSFIFRILGYKYLGLDGLGIAFLGTYLLGFIHYIVITNLLYSFKFEKGVYKMFSIMFIILLASLWVIIEIDGFRMYLIGVLLIAISSVYSFKELDRRLDMKNLIHEFNNRYLKK